MEAEPPFPQGLLEEGSEEAAVLAGVAKKQDRAPLRGEGLEGGVGRAGVDLQPEGSRAVHQAEAGGAQRSLKGLGEARAPEGEEGPRVGVGGHLGA